MVQALAGVVAKVDHAVSSFGGTDALTQAGVGCLLRALGDEKCQGKVQLDKIR